MLSILSLLLVGCPSEKVSDISSLYEQEPVLQKGYKLGQTYVLQTNLFVTKGDRPDYRFTKPGDGVPTVEEWRAGVRKPQFFKVIALLPAGTKVVVEKIIYLKATGSGGNHATGMLRAAGVDHVISPVSVSDVPDVRPYGTLCVPDPKFAAKPAINKRWC
jgi:hypothetical protein